MTRSIKRNRILFLVVTCFIFLKIPMACAQPCAQVPSFHEIGPFVGWSFLRAGDVAVTADGLVVVAGSGHSPESLDTEAFRWTLDCDGVKTIEGLGPGQPGWIDSTAYSISPDGLFIGGSLYNGGGYGDAMIWTDGIGWKLPYTPLNPDLTSAADGSGVGGISENGSLISGHVAYYSLEKDTEAVLWTHVDQLDSASMINLGDFQGGNFSSRANDISADGSVVVGSGTSDSGREAFRWTWMDINSNGQIDPAETLGSHSEFGLGDLPGGTFYSSATAVSADGSVIVGSSNSAQGTEAFGWTDLNNNGLLDSAEILDLHSEFGLGDLAGGGFKSVAYDVSADGSVIVGAGTSDVGSEAFIWDSVNGMRSLQDVLTSYGLDVGHLDAAIDISADGSTIIGSNWVAIIPEPATLSLLALGALSLLRRKESLHSCSTNVNVE